MTDTKLIKVSEAEYASFILSIARPNPNGTARVVADVPYVRQDGPTQIAEYRAADGRVIARHTSAMNRGSSYYITSPRFAAPWFACLGYQYADFAAHWESRGYDFPCTSEQFRARVAEYAGDNQSLAEVLINQGGAT